MSKGREHVMPQFLGTIDSKSPVLREVCDECNSTFSRKLEDIAKTDSQEGVIASQMQLRTRSRTIIAGNRFKEQSALPTADGIFDSFLPDIDLASGNRVPREQVVLGFENGQRQILYVNDPKFEENIKRFARAKCTKNILANSPNRLVEIEDAMRRAGMSYTRLDTREINEQDMESIAHRDVTQTIDLSMFRLAAKIGFNHFAYCMKELGRLEVCYGATFDAVREFVLHATLPNPVEVSFDQLMCQDGWIPRTAPFHMLIWRRENKMAISEVSLFSLRRYSVKLGALPDELLSLSGKGHRFDLRKRQVRELDVVIGAPPVVPNKRAFDWRVDVEPR